MRTCKNKLMVLNVVKTGTAATTTTPVTTPSPITCDGSMFRAEGNTARFHSNTLLISLSTGSKDPGQKFKSTLVFPCYEEGQVTYTCGQNSKFETNETCKVLSDSDEAAISGSDEAVIAGGVISVVVILLVIIAVSAITVKIVQ